MWKWVETQKETIVFQPSIFRCYCWWTNPADQLISSLPTIIYRVFIHPRWLFGNSSNNSMLVPGGHISFTSDSIRAWKTEDPMDPVFFGHGGLGKSDSGTNKIHKSTNKIHKSTNKSQHLIIFNDHKHINNIIWFIRFIWFYMWLSSYFNRVGVSYKQKNNMFPSPQSHSLHVHVVLPRNLVCYWSLHATIAPPWYFRLSAPLWLEPPGEDGMGLVRLKWGWPGGHRPSYGRGTKCVFLGFCCVDATQVMGVMGWGGGDGNVPWRCTHGRCYGNDGCLGLGWGWW